MGKGRCGSRRKNSLQKARWAMPCPPRFATYATLHALTQRLGINHAAPAIDGVVAGSGDGHGGANRRQRRLQGEDTRRVLKIDSRVCSEPCAACLQSRASSQASEGKVPASPQQALQRAGTSMACAAESPHPTPLRS
jgi:hypothetical protein